MSDLFSHAGFEQHVPILDANIDPMPLFIEAPEA